VFQFPDDRAHGVVLAQLVEDRKLKFEALVGRTAAEVTGFTAAAARYER